MEKIRDRPHSEVFISTEPEAIQRLNKSSSLTLYGVQETIRTYEVYPCQVVDTFVSRSPLPLSMALPKGSPLTAFMEHSFLRYGETPAMTNVKH